MALVLRLSRVDVEGSFVLVHVEPNGPRPLDLKLIGTEGSAPFVLSLKHSRISSLRAKNSPCSPEEWEVILDSIFHRKVADKANLEVLQDVEAMASVEENISITITFRKRVSGITQRLGQLQLGHNEDQEIELYDWCGLAVQETSSIASTIATLEEKYRGQEEVVKNLQSEIQKLIEAKTDHENELLEKFRDLLNEKKAKIRDQQRLLASATVVPQKLAAVKESGNGRSRAVGASRSGKRKSARSDPIEEEEDFEAMEVDSDKIQNDSVEEEARTTDDETADEDDGDAMAQPPSSNLRSTTTAQVHEGSEDEKPPPRRELPFSKKPAAASAIAPDEEEETASEDEL